MTGYKVVEREAYETPGGAKGIRTRYSSPHDQRLMDLCVPDTAGPESPLVLGYAGRPGNTGMVNPGVAYTDPMHEAGYADGWMFLSLGTGETWGDESAMRQTSQAVAFVRQTWPATRVLAYGYSMGGMSVYNLLGRKPFPGLVGGVTINGTATTIERLGYTTPGYAPLEDDPERWRDVPFFISASPNDPTVPSTRHAEVFIGRAVTPEKITYHNHGGNHFGGWAPELITPWMIETINAAPIGDTTMPGAGGSGVWDLDGNEIAIYDLNGNRFSFR